MGFLKKDYNRHHSYNTAVTLFRIAVVLGVLALGFFIWRKLYVPPLMADEGIHDFVITDKRSQTFHHRRSTTTYYYIDCVDEKGEKHHQTVTRSNYLYLEKGKTYSAQMFSREDGVRYISWGKLVTAKQATKDYYNRYPDTTMQNLSICWIACAGLGVLFVAAGIGTLKKGQKYLQDTEIIRTGNWYKGDL